MLLSEADPAQKSRLSRPAFSTALVSVGVLAPAPMLPIALRVSLAKMCYSTLRMGALPEPPTQLL